MPVPVAKTPALPITARAVCTALGMSSSECADALSRGRSGLGRPAMDLPFETLVGAVDSNLPRVPTAMAEYDSRVGRIALHLADECAPAVERARRRWGADRVAVLFGTSTGGLAETEAAVACHRATGHLPGGYDLHRQHSMRAVSELIALRFALRGPSYAISTACSSGAKVFAAAQRLLRAGVVDAVLLGGIDSLCQTTLRGFRSLGILATERCRPFGLGREGLNLGEGGGLFLLERVGDAPFALLGVGESSDGFRMSAPPEDGYGAVVAMQGALAQAGRSADAVDYVNAHGTGTAKNDLAEARAIKRVFDRRVPVASTKGYTGHTLGAAGAIEAAFAMFALEGEWIPASLGASPADPDIDLDLPSERRSARCRVVMSNSFGFGGSNVSLVLGVE